MIRDPLAVKAKLCECVFIAIWYGMLYWRRDNTWSNETFQYSWAQIRDINVGGIYSSLIFTGFVLGFDARIASFRFHPIHGHGRLEVHDAMAASAARDQRQNL